MTQLVRPDNTVFCFLSQCSFYWSLFDHFIQSLWLSKYFLMFLNIRLWWGKWNPVFPQALSRLRPGDSEPSGTIVRIINISLAELALGLQSLTPENGFCSWAFHHCEVTYIIIQCGLANIKKLLCARILRHFTEKWSLRNCPVSSCLWPLPEK